MGSRRADVTAAMVSLLVLVAVAVIVVGKSGGFGSGKDAQQIPPSAQAQQPEPGGSVRSFQLTTAPATLEDPKRLHGGAFQILAFDGQPVQSELVKDTVLVDPGNSITIGFRADNPGWWMLHCHELHHAAGGMDTLIRHSGFDRLANLGGQYGNSPE